MRIGSPLPRHSLGEIADRIRRSFLGVIREVDIVQYDPPPFQAIETGLLTRSLDLEVGGHILGITDADLRDGTGSDFWSFMFGGKDDSNDVAVVSLHRLRSTSSAVSGARLLKVAVHELGHNFGLLHHYDDRRTRDGYCPMSKGDFNRFGERAYVRAVIDSRGYRFCRACRRFLHQHYA